MTVVIAKCVVAWIPDRNITYQPHGVTLMTEVLAQYTVTDS